MDLLLHLLTRLNNGHPRRVLRSRVRTSAGRAEGHLVGMRRGVLLLLLVMLLLMLLGVMEGQRGVRACVVAAGCRMCGHVGRQTGSGGVDEGVAEGEVVFDEAVVVGDVLLPHQTHHVGLLNEWGIVRVGRGMTIVLLLLLGVIPWRRQHACSRAARRARRRHPRVVVRDGLEVLLKGAQ